MTARWREPLDLAASALSLWRLRVVGIRRDSFPEWLGGLSFCGYLLLGRLLANAGGFERENTLFNADCIRVVSDTTRAHEGMPSINASAAHPFFLLAANPLGAALAWLLGPSGVLATQLLSHACAALANVLVYRLLLRFLREVPLARAGALVHALSTTQLLFGSIPETGALTGLGLALSLWGASRSLGVWSAAASGVLTFGANGALLAHALLAAPVLWFGRSSMGPWLRRSVLFLLAFVALGLALMLLQRLLFPSVTLLGSHGYTAYEGFLQIPKTSAALLYRWERLLPHLLAFCVVAPSPMCTSPPHRIVTFMWEQEKRIATYDPLAMIVVALWLALGVLALGAQLRALVRGPTLQRNLALLVLGWFLGVLGFFTVFGDDLLLFSFFWELHLVLFVITGLGAFPPGSRRTAALTLFLALLAFNQLRFVGQVLGHVRG